MRDHAETPLILQRYPLRPNGVHAAEKPGVDGSILSLGTMFLNDFSLLRFRPVGAMLEQC